ncbi:H - or Na -translocating F-type, V-type and A-type ATPase (F-ATPase) Superfamily [Thraustotheca clavata]|uniref:V-type proton ATPase subunit C n=1 Tax=Thraustotheca clavata TaxID=74557 RepID=A0A1V9Y793_9STRA|nr:H - or Na -translocating F-type, V-type and A-type ATPase (F-ATPase) Superfamily [Thraustotheca clavata]
MSYLVVAVPNEGRRSSDTTFNELKAETASSKNDLAECHRFDLPSDLLVGTLDSLMVEKKAKKIMLIVTLGEDMHRIDMTVESAVRKIERQFHDLNKGGEALTVDGVPVERYLSHFSWDEAKHPHRRPLSEIVSIIQTSIGKIEDELKQLSTRYTEKKQQLALYQKKKGGNLLVANLADVLTPDVVKASDFVNTEYLQTLVVVVPKSQEEAWLNEYEKIGEDIAEYGPKKSRGTVKGSPVVPGSSRKLFEEGDSTLYTVTILKGQYQSGTYDNDGNFEAGTLLDYVEKFKHAAREKRFQARDFTYDPTAHATNETMIAELEVEVNRLYTGLLRWCKAHFGETFIAWMHVKAVRTFVEAVLRYGLPVNFVAILYRLKSGKEKKLRTILEKRYEHLQPSQFAHVEDTANVQEYFSYVSNSFNPLAIA